MPNPLPNQITPGIFRSKVFQFLIPVHLISCLFIIFFCFSFIQAQELICKLKEPVLFSSSPSMPVKFTNSSVEQLFIEYDLRISGKVFLNHADRLDSPLKNIVRITTNSTDQLSRALTELQNNPYLEWIEPIYSFKIHFQPNDSLYSRQWYMAPLQLPQAWDLQQGKASIIVGVIDTGIDYFHPELEAQLWINTSEDLNRNGQRDVEDLNGIDDDGNGYIDDVIGWDFTDAPQFPDDGDYLIPDNDPMDEYPGGHGTPVAGIINALINNQIGIAGVAPGVRVMNLRAGTAAGYLEIDDVAEAIVYAVDNGCKIINMSFGDVVYSHLLREAIAYGANKGVLFVASAGNSGNQVLHYPAAYDQTIAVGATDSTGRLASFSNYGSKIDLVAPGVNILSLSTFMEYGAFSGTSFSAPMVSGILALLWSEQESASALQITSQLLAGCSDVGAPGWDIYYGHGLANAYAALTVPVHSLVQIEYPETGRGVCQAQVAIKGSATGSQFKQYQINLGMGNNPISWTPIFQSSRQIIHDTLAVWNTASFPDTLYTIELTVLNWDLSRQVNRVVVELDRTAPRLLAVDIKPMIIEDYLGFFVELDTDDPTVAYLHCRESGGSAFNLSFSSPYSQTSHNFILTQQESTSELEFYVELENNAGLTSTWDNQGHYYQIDLRSSLRFSSDWQFLTGIPGSGFFLSRSVDCNNDGILDIFGNVRWPNQIESRLSCLNFSNQQLTAYVSDISGFARDLYDVNRDGWLDLLAGYGSSSFLFSGIHLPAFTGQPILSPEPDFWGARLYDLDNDGQSEVIALHQNNWHIYQLVDTENFSVSYIQTLMNPTSGDNQYGVPQVEIADMNHNGKPELILGDYDGDLIVYESSQSNEYVPIATMRLEGVDATHRFAIGDVNGDGKLEIVIATQQLAPSLGESSIINQYWILNILELDNSGSLNSIWQKYFYPLVDKKNALSGLSVHDYDSDGKDEIFFTPFPRAYFIRFENGDFKVDWYTPNINCNAVPLVNDRQILLPEDSVLSIWELQTSPSRPIPVAFFKAIEVDSNLVELEWRAVDNADGYQLTRCDLSDHSFRVFICSENFFSDSSVVNNHEYEYWVQTVDSSFAQPLSVKSKSIRLKAESPPVFQRIEVISASQLSLEFSKPLGLASFNGEKFYLLPESLIALNAMRGKGSHQLILGFQNPIPSGPHLLRVKDLVNTYGIPFLRDSLIIPFDMTGELEFPYVQKVEMVSKSELIVIFNHPMDPVTAENPDNYFIEPDDHVTDAHLDVGDDSIVHIKLTGKNRMGSLGENYYLTIKNLKDIWGKSLAVDWNHRFLIIKTVDNLDNLIVFPNPLTPDAKEMKITFGNLPQYCQIYIYDVNGHLVTNIENENTSGGIQWDLHSESGSLVANGVYLYVAKYQEQTKMGKFVVVR